MAENSVLVLLHRIVGPAVADAEIDPAAAQPIDGADHVGDQDGISQRGEIDRRAQANAPSAGADGGEGRERVEPRFGDHAVADPDRVKAERLGAIGEIVDAARIGPPGQDHFAGGQKNAEFSL